MSGTHQMGPKTLGATQGTHPSGQGQGQTVTLQLTLRFNVVTIPSRATTHFYH